MYDARAHRELCDVGGSAGTIAAGFLRANPQLRGTVLDRPEVVPMATQAIAEAGLAERCRAVGGDFFAEVPAADLYVIKHILHDWSDDQCRTLLRNVARSSSPGRSSAAPDLCRRDAFAGILAAKWAQPLARSQRL